MTLELTGRISGCLLGTVLACCATVAHAAAGFSITQSDEAQVAVGMTQAEVQQKLGPPARTRHYPNRPGPSWTYAVRGAPFGGTDFDIDFGADGKVVNTFERSYGSSH